MRGHTAGERRSGQLQRLAHLGLLSDDTCLSTFSYPTLDPSQERSLHGLAEWLTPSSPTESTTRIERSNALHDTRGLLLQVVQLAGHNEAEDAPPPAPSAIVQPLSRMLERSATAEDLQVVRTFAKSLAQVTLMLTEQVANEKDPQDWTTTPLTYSGVRSQARSAS